MAIKQTAFPKYPSVKFLLMSLLPVEPTHPYSCILCLATRLHMDTQCFWMWLQHAYLMLAFRKITSSTRDPRSLPLSERGRQEKKKKKKQSQHWWLTHVAVKRQLGLWVLNREEEVFRWRDARHDRACKYARADDVVLSVHAQSCIRPPGAKPSTARGSCSANFALVTHVRWCLGAFFSCCTILHVDRRLNTNLLTWITFLKLWQ